MYAVSLRSLLSRLHVRRVSLDDLEQWAVTSKAVAWAVIAGLLLLGFLASLYARLPLFAGLMAACFLLATALVCRRALLRYAGRTLRLLVTARLVIVLILGGVLFCTTGAAWTAVASSVLLWLAAERLLSKVELTVLTGPADAEDHPSISVGCDGDPSVDPAQALAESEAVEAGQPASDPSDRLFSHAPHDPAAPTVRPRRKGACKR